MTLAEWPDHLPGYAWYPAKWHDRGPPFHGPPSLVVIHSGSTSPRVAEYIRRMPDGRKVSAHFSWHGARGLFVQQVHLTREAWHVGGSRFGLSRGRVNPVSYGIELPGPWRENPRSDRQKLFLRSLLDQLRSFCADECYLTAHSWIDYRKHDPGPGVTPCWFDGLGYKVVWQKCRGRQVDGLVYADGGGTKPPTP